MFAVGSLAQTRTTWDSKKGAAFDIAALHLTVRNWIIKDSRPGFPFQYQFNIGGDAPVIPNILAVSLVT